MKLVSVCMVLATLVLTAGRKYPDGWQFVPLPPEDEFATNRFGRSWLEPVYNGYVIISNRYLDAPYVVEQRGFVIFVNGERIEDGTDIRLVSPTPEPAPVTVDPGPVTNLSKRSTLSDLFRDPTYRAKQEYWNQVGVFGEERFRMSVELIRSLSCVSNIVDLKSETFDGREVRVWDHHGNEWLVSLQTTPRTPKRTATDAEMYGHIMGALGADHNILSSEGVVHILNGALRGPTGVVWDTNRWMEVFKVLFEEGAVSQKVARIRATEALGSASDHHIQTMLPMDGFIPTPQLWKRLSGDTSWTNDAPARLLALTNGWQRIPPAFMRTQVVAVATVPGASTRSAGGTSAVGGATTRVGSSTGLDSPAPGSGQTASDTRPGNAKLLLVLALVGTLAGALFVARRLIRK